MAEDEEVEEVELVVLLLLMPLLLLLLLDEEVEDAGEVVDVPLVLLDSVEVLLFLL